MPRVLLAMSGGVDSSVAAHLLLRRGYDVIGAFMANGGSEAPGRSREDTSAAESRAAWEPAAPSWQGCRSAADAEDARRVADQLQLPFHVLDLHEEFARVMDYFADQYASGRTPNPCAVCNKWLKFGRLFDYADGVGAEFVATGHHARITRDEGSGRPALCCGVDPRKDQSYVLFGVDRSRLPRMILPVGEHRKAEIRSVAQGLGLRVAGKRESQEICFVEPGSHARFVRDRRGDAGATGEIVTTDGRVVGRHDGIERFTIGQRKGLGVALGEPQFVVRIEADTHRVVIGGRGELARRELTAGGVNWLVDAPRDAFRCRAKIRYNSPSAEALAEPLAGDRLRVQFDQPCYGVAPGQAVVCYCADRVLGGGWIE